MQSSTATSDPKLVNHLLMLVDRIGHVLKVNVPSIVELKEMQHLPDTTLGGALVNFLNQQNLPPLNSGPRRKQLHDCVHVLTGYGTDSIGEAEVQAFLLGAKFHPIHILLGLSLLKMIQRQLPHSQSLVWNRLQKAYLRGRMSTFDVDRWRPEDQWHLSLTQLRAEFQIME